MYIETNYEFRMKIQKEIIENEMQRTKENAVRAISKIAHFEEATLMKILSYSFLEGHEDAENLAHKLNLGKLDFLAAIDNYDAFKEEYLKDQELNYAQNF